MQWISIGQYFYKLYSAVLILLLVPIIAFIFIYWQMLGTEPVSARTFETALPILIIALISWLFMFFFYNKKIKSIRNRQGLRAKLEKYFILTIVRYTVAVTGCLVLAYGFYLTRDNWFTGMFVLGLLVLGLMWPTSAKVCKDLKLRGDEREMVYFKKDYL
jgi:hypothetical protein